MTALRRSVAALLAVFCVPSAASADTYPRQPSVDAVHYVFRVVVTDGSNEIAGETTVTMRARSDGVRDIELDLTLAAAGKGMTVGAVTQQVAGAPVSLAFTHRTDRLRVSLPAPLMTGDEVSFTVAYTGIPAEGLRLIDNMPRNSPENFLGATPTTEKFRPLRLIVLFSTEVSRLKNLVQRASLISTARGAPGISSDGANADPIAGWTPSTEK